MTRLEHTQSIIDRAIERGDIKTLLDMAVGPLCACRGADNDEPRCCCKMNSLQVREIVSLAGLQRGKIIKLRHHEDACA